MQKHNTEPGGLIVSKDGVCRLGHLAPASHVDAQPVDPKILKTARFRDKACLAGYGIASCPSERVAFIISYVGHVLGPQGMPVDRCVREKCQVGEHRLRLKCGQRQRVNVNQTHYLYKFRELPLRVREQDPEPAQIGATRPFDRRWRVESCKNGADA
jgi:hypothetical protein